MKMVMLMEYLKHIERAVGYIENNLSEKLTVSCCAQVCSYSDYYFLRIFKSVTGYTPMEYVRKRRLSEASKELLDSPKPIIDIALRWGFDSLENFIRAFQSEHGITPGSYRRQKNSLHLFNPQNQLYGQHNTNISLEPQIQRKDSLILYGYTFLTNSANRHYDIPKFWNRYHVKKLGKNFDNLYCSTERIDVGWLEECPNGLYKYTIGVIANEDGLNGTEKIIIPPAAYAVFETPLADAFTFVENIHSTWDYIYSKWLPQSQYKQANSFAFECYCEESRIFSEKIYVPVVIK
jgi:AraC family transcriptional regulator